MTETVSWPTIFTLIIAMLVLAPFMDKIVGVILFPIIAIAAPLFNWVTRHTPPWVFEVGMIALLLSPVLYVLFADLPVCKRIFVLECD